MPGYKPITPKSAKTTLGLHYSHMDDYAKREFIDSVVRALGVNKVSVWRWMRGEHTPNKLFREKLAEISGLSVETIFDRIER